ncbi:MAG TPA: cyclic nucleotide-binding domain-containing protein [Pyrinomonadaceae bacterium]|nr:cyclic nucleotide-binding domain-containing protein [Pyrinomonadaceae bacterium]
MNEQYADLIPSFPLFKGFTKDGANRLLKSGEVKEYGAGEVVLKEGDAADCALLLLSGGLEVFVERDGKDLVLTETKPGTVVGELAVLCGIPRSASVRAKQSAAVLEWSDEAFRTLLLRDPHLSQRIFGQILRTLVEKESALIDSLLTAQHLGQSTR